MNSRRFKLRVWSTKHKCFLDEPIGNGWADCMETDVWLSSYGIPQRMNLDVCCRWHGIEVDGPVKNNEFIIQQSTGLTDLNKRLVFEGDIVQDCREAHRGKPFVFKVVWDKGIAGFSFKEIRLSGKMYSAQKLTMSNISETIVLGNHLQGYSLQHLEV